MRKFISICIPSYNRPDELELLLKSIDCDKDEVNIVICEDKAPKRVLVRKVVKNFINLSNFETLYYENISNLGFDGNIRRLVEKATGEYIIFMGDDDLFIPGQLSKFINFLHKHRGKAYFLRSYLAIHDNGKKEYFKYLKESKVLNAGEKTVAWLFKRSVSICGFTIAREKALSQSTSDIDGTLLYQIYLMSQICLKHDSVYCDIPFVQCVQTYRNDRPMFGSSKAERERYRPGSVLEDNSINFTKSYFELANYIDKLHGTQLTKMVSLDLSKYSYPFLSIQRKRGILKFLNYANRLDKEIGFGKTIYFHIYKWSLLILGERVCDRVIIIIKRIIGYTPNF